MMPATWRASIGYLVRHPWQLCLSMLGVGIGVAVIVAVDLANASSRKAFLMSMDAVTGEATHQVVGGPAGVDESVYVELRVKHGMRAIAPVVDGTVTSGDLSLQLLGVDLFAESEIRAFTGPQADAGSDTESLFGEFLLTPGAVTMSIQLADRLDVAVGDTLTIIADGRERQATLLATIDDPSGRFADLLVADIATSQEWLGKFGLLSRIDVRIEDGDTQALAALEAALPASVRLLNASGRTRATAEMSKAFMTNLTAMSLLALLVGLFLIFNSVSFSVLQRRHLIGVLRGLGVTRKQLFAIVLAEAALLGVIASLLGVALGVLLGEQLLALVSRSINDLYFRISVTNVSVAPASIAKGLIAGIGASLAAATVPALEATSYQPRLALARSALERRTRELLPVVTGAGVIVLLAAVILLAVSGRNLVAGLTAVFLLILGFSSCVPFAVRHLSQWLAPAAHRIAGMPARLAIGGIAAGLSRTGVAVVALAVALSATIGVSVMVDSFRGSVNRWLEQSLQADVYAGVQRGALDADLLEALRRIDGVEATSTSRRGWIEESGVRTQLVAIRMAPGSYAGTEILDADPADVWPAWETGDAVLVSEPYGYYNEVGAGSRISLPTDAGPRDFDVLGTYQSYDVNASAVMMSRATYDRYFDDDGVDTLGLYLEDGVSADDVVVRAQALSAGRQEIRVDSNVRIRELSLEIFDQTFVITNVLYWLAMGVAFIGILSAMFALQLERARELATLRALGMTPRQVGGMIALQSGGIGLLSGIASIPLGVVMAWVLIEVINRRAFGWQIDMSVAPGILVTSVLFAVLTAILAGVYPARRAARSEPALAMREE
jgi:putative ABC transport system permease protein